MLTGPCTMCVACAVVVSANGEIYNYRDLYAELGSEYKPKTGSDCEVRHTPSTTLILTFLYPPNRSRGR
jgi:hypothetical protein